MKYILILETTWLWSKDEGAGPMEVKEISEEEYEKCWKHADGTYGSEYDITFRDLTSKVDIEGMDEDEASNEIYEYLSESGCWVDPEDIEVNDGYKSKCIEVTAKKVTEEEFNNINSSVETLKTLV